jgi:hypothetical protein
VYDGTAREVNATTDPEGLNVVITYAGNLANAPTNAGSYEVIGTITEPNYVGSATNTLVVSPAAATVTLTNLAQVYDGTARVVGATTAPTNLNLTITYAGELTAPTNAGSYEVIGTINELNYVGSATNTLVVSPANATVTLTNLAQVYDGTARVVGATTEPTNLNLTITYAGEANAPTNAGSYEVIGTITEPNYVGSATNTLVVSPANATVTLTNLAQVYDGTARVVGATTEPTNLNLTITYAGEANAPTNAGSYEVIGTIAEPNYVGSATNTLVVSPAAATVTLTNLAQVYDGTARVVGATTEPTNLNLTITYAGEANAPTNAGSYEVIGTITEPNYVGSATNTLVVSPAAATITLTNLAQVYDGTARVVGATTDPTNLNVTITYAGEANAPTNAGSYEVIGTINELNYAGSATNTLVVSPAAATVTLTNLAQVYDGTARVVGATTDPTNLNVTITYAGEANAPTNAGSYEVIGTINELNYVGSATNTLVVVDPTVVLSINPLSADTVALSWNSISGRTYRVQYKNDLADSGWLELLPHVTATTTNSSLTNFVGGQPQRFYRIRTLSLNPATASVTLSNLNQSYDGTGRQADAITVPEGLNVSITYNGSATMPTNAGTYEVIAAIVEPDFVGGTTNTLVVSPAAATVTLLNLAQTYDGTARVVNVATDPEELNVSFTYAGEPNAPTNAGSYEVIGTINEPNYVGSGTNTLVVSPASATVTLLNLAQTYDGTARVVGVTTAPEGLNVVLTYAGAATAPTNAGIYTVIGTINELNYVGSATNELVVSPASATVTLLNLAQTYDGTARVVGVTTAPEGLNVVITYADNLAAPTNAGSYEVIGTISELNYVGSTTNMLVVSPASATVTLLNLAQTYDGTAREVGATTAPEGLNVTLTYAGAANAPTNAGSYEVIGTIAEQNYVGSQTNLLVVSPAAATVTLLNLAQIYDGTARVVGATTDPEGLNVTLTYAGEANAPTNAGSYEVIGTIAEQNYVGSATNTLVVVAPEPIILSLEMVSAGEAAISWNAIPNLTYRLRYKDNLTDADWIDLPPDLTATDSLLSVTNSVGSQPQRFYRVELLY